MDLRRGPRYEVDQPVTVTDLETKQPFPGKLANFSTHGVRILLDRSVAPGAIIKIEWRSTLLLGEVIYCRQEGGGFAVGMELEDALYDTEALALQMGAAVPAGNVDV